MAILTSTQRVRLGRRPDAVELAPGRAVPVRDDRVEALLDAGNGLGRRLFEAGMLKLEVTRTSEPVAFAIDLAELSIAKAAPVIAAESDLDRLARWRASDERAGIHALIDKRVEALLAPPEE